MRWKNIVNRSLSSEIAPMVYVMMTVNLLIGIFFATHLFMAPTTSILYGVGVLVYRELWGALLVVTASTALYGMVRDNRWATMVGGLAGFMLWLFACISLFQGGFWYVLISTGLFHLLFHGYVYLASAANVLRREFYRRS